ncbi:hypothetical protein CVT24_002878 [Panaeolus cyanescens]|uniref:MYND-type domain-containing protein n=1 Tax=Panaeolus cyanescens TaxID=181874 RepID=A0A409YRN4_9AGAR|nr:hypothetical protein CVT24_002878 [Panaeolus cyanescens]
MSRNGSQARVAAAVAELPPTARFDTVNAIRYLLSGLVDVHNPTYCSGSLHFAISKIDDMRNFSDKCWSIFYEFLFVERTEEQVQALLKKLSKCTCKEDAKGIHRRYVAVRDSRRRVMQSLNRDVEESTGPASRETEWFFESAFNQVRERLERVDVVDVTKGVGKSWPRKLSDLLPGGPDVIVQSIIRWQRTIPDSFMIPRATIRLIGVCQYTLHDSLIKYNTMNNLVLEPTRNRLLTYISKLEAGESIDVDDFVTVVSNLVSYTSQVCGQAMKSGLLMSQGEIKALQLCSLILYIADALRPRIKTSRNFENAYDFTSTVGYLIIRDFNMRSPDRPNLKLHPAIVAKDIVKTSSPSQKETPEHVAALAMIAGREHHLCSCLTCELSFSQVGNAFKMCNNCQTVGYCDRACQVKDWKDEKYPHKGICEVLKKVVQARGGWRAPLPFEFQDMAVEGLAVTKGDLVILQLEALMTEMKERGKLTEDEWESLLGWGKRLYEEKVMGGKSRMGSVYNPGYDDYEVILSRFTGPKGLKGSIPVFIPRSDDIPDDLCGGEVDLLAHMEKMMKSLDIPIPI